MSTGNKTFPSDNKVGKDHLSGTNKNSWIYKYLTREKRYRVWKKQVNHAQNFKKRKFDNNLVWIIS